MGQNAVDSLKCNFSRKKGMMNCIFGMQIEIKVDTIILGEHRLAQSIQNKKFPYLCNISGKTWAMKLLLCLLINTEVFYNLIVSFWACKVGHAQST